MSKPPVPLLIERVAALGTSVTFTDPKLSVNGIHTVFKIRAVIPKLNLSSIGNGRTKKEARRNAATTLLKKLRDRGYINPDADLPSESHTSINAVGILEEATKKLLIPGPLYHEAVSHGPPNCPEFVVECQFLDKTVVGKGDSKKAAKQDAAKYALDSILENYYNQSV